MIEASDILSEIQDDILLIISPPKQSDESNKTLGFTERQRTSEKNYCDKKIKNKKKQNSKRLTDD